MEADVRQMIVWLSDKAVQMEVYVRTKEAARRGEWPEFKGKTNPAAVQEFLEKFIQRYYRNIRHQKGAKDEPAINQSL